MILDFRSFKLLSAIVCFLLILWSPLAAEAQKPLIDCHPIAGTPPVIDGAVSADEWPGAPQIVFDATTPNPNNYNFVIPTYIYFLNDAANLYILVDAVGDASNNNSAPLDECLLVFGVGSQYFLPEIWGDGTFSNCTPPGVTAAAGFGTSMNSQTEHRIYEWKIPFSSIGAVAGQTIDFSSPTYLKFSTECPSNTGSIPYDAETYNDNVWPPDSENYITDPNNRDQWGLLRLQRVDTATVPTLSEWGLLVLGVLMLVSGAGYIRRMSRSL